MATKRPFMQDAMKRYGCESPMEALFYVTFRNKYGDVLAVQYEIYRYRLDFAHLDTKTVIEIDGKAYHSTEEQIKQDAFRERWFKAHGWLVIRFTGSQVKNDVKGCVERAKLVIESRVAAA